jgi:hypothetical protein
VKSSGNSRQPPRSKSLSLGRGVLAVADSGAIRSPHVRGAASCRHVLRHHEVLASCQRESPISDSSTLRSPHVRGVKHAVRICANGVAFWGGTNDMNSMRLRWFGKRTTCCHPDPKFADRFIA